MTADLGETVMAHRPPLAVVIAGGGTGGHIFPGIALAEAFQEMNPASRILFAGTGNRLETEAIRRTPFEHRAISAGGLKGRGPIRQAAALLKVAKGLMESFALLRTFKPNLVIGVGGYVSGPMVLAARLLGITCVLQEQNVVPGITNRMLAPLVRRIFATFPDTRGKVFRKKMVVMGNPVRKDFLQSMDAFGNAESGKTKDRFTVLVVGGSQGAKGINEAVTEALDHLPLERMEFVHQTGMNELSSVRAAYGVRGAMATVEPFFVDIANWYRATDLVICRSGATTVAEVTAMGKPAVFIPFPFAADDHQRLNAQSLVEQGAAEMILEKDLTGKLLAGRISYYEHHPEALCAMAEKARACGKPDAARRIVEDCYGLLEGRLVPPQRD
jgi:UDP-N-acetylglucosamine--N-acetylmuramyl-(pentapeptide) pyrophosphoryl-undecaprenol N-acetylglucosamine transferase